jgi:dihydroceramidase
MSASLALVGVCSFAFHATLRQTMQFGDGLSMLFLAGSLIQRLYCAGQQQASTRRLITATVYAAVCLMSVYYVQTGNLVVHMSMFEFVGTLMGLLVYPRTMYLFFWPRQVQSPQEKERLSRKFSKASACLSLGFLLWNLDLKECQMLRNLRNASGAPWSWVLELHGWWHFLTALGVAVLMDLIRDLCP